MRMLRCAPAMTRANANGELISEGPAMDEVWKQAGRKNFAVRRIADLRLGLSLIRHGVTDFATANTQDFSNMGFPVPLTARGHGTIRMTCPA